MHNPSKQRDFFIEGIGLTTQAQRLQRGGSRCGKEAAEAGAVAAEPVRSRVWLDAGVFGGYMNMSGNGTRYRPANCSGDLTKSSKLFGKAQVFRNLPVGVYLQDFANDVGIE